MVRIVPAANKEEIALARELFLEYAQGLGVDLCFQSFDVELAGLPGDYAPPQGRLFLAYGAMAGDPSSGAGPQLAGCGALRRIDDSTCEMKRLYVRPGFRGQKVGRELTAALIAAAREIGYSRMVLDTLPSMAEAQKLYRSLGFREIPPYRHNPVPGALFLELLLS